MARRRIMQYGPTSLGSTPRSRRVVVWDYAPSSRDGVFLRKPVGIPYGRTTKSRLSRKIVKGTEPPGRQPYNYLSPED